jgi:hypothetical protein
MLDRSIPTSEALVHSIPISEVKDTYQFKLPSVCDSSSFITTKSRQVS